MNIMLKVLATIIAIITIPVVLAKIIIEIWTS
jgi:hypothetical protein